MGCLSSVGGDKLCRLGSSDIHLPLLRAQAGPGRPVAIQDPIELFRLIKKEGITLADFVPSHWRHVSWSSRTCLNRNGLIFCKRLETNRNGGEPLLPDLPFAWRSELNHPAQLVNIFGQTETTGLITNYPIVSGPMDSHRFVSIGWPIPETRLYVLEPQSSAQVREGEIGELCVSNPCVAKGYLHYPA